MLRAFLGACRIDPDFFQLLNAAGGNTGHIVREGFTQREDVRPGGILYNPGRAKDLVELIARACDLLLTRVDQVKHMGFRDSEEGLQIADSPFSSCRIRHLPADSPEQRLLHLARNGALRVGGEILPAFDGATSALRAGRDPIKARQHARLDSSGVVTKVDAVILSVLTALHAVSGLTDGNATLFQNNRSTFGF